MGQVLDALGYFTTSPTPGLELPVSNVFTSSRQNTPRQEPREAAPMASISNAMVSSMLNPTTPFPTWEKVLSMAGLYLIYCHAQPLPLFHRDSFLNSLGSRDPEIIYAMLALSIRFSDDVNSTTNDLTSLINSYTEVARGLVMKRVSEGPIELSTLQSLCLLSLVDFASNTTNSVRSTGTMLT